MNTKCERKDNTVMNKNMTALENCISPRKYLFIFQVLSKSHHYCRLKDTQGMGKSVTERWVNNAATLMCPFGEHNDSFV